MYTLMGIYIYIHMICASYGSLLPLGHITYCCRIFSHHRFTDETARAYIASQYIILHGVHWPHSTVQEKATKLLI